jgi:hypothetical protein
VDREDVRVGNVTETEVLIEVLGEDGLTDDRTADLARSVRIINRARTERALQIKIIMHGLHAELGTWEAVSDKLDVPKTTVWNWAHAEI